LRRASQPSNQKISGSTTSARTSTNASVGDLVHSATTTTIPTIGSTSTPSRLTEAPWDRTADFDEPDGVSAFVSTAFSSGFAGSWARANTSVAARGSGAAIS
jgi:hypothetical protein